MTPFAMLARERESGVSRRVFGSRYLTLRRETEARLREAFVSGGGFAARAAPHYFCLGASPWFAGLADDMEARVFPLVALPPASVSFTWCDSFTAMGVNASFGLPYEPHPTDGRVFRLSELPDVVAEYGLPQAPDDDHDGYERRPFRHYVELQLWVDHWGPA